MNPTSQTLKFLGIAAASIAVAALASWSTQPSEQAGFGEVGQEFFPKFDEVTEAAGVTVVAYDDDTRESLSFSVKKNDDGLWTIPSHENYPAEAADQLAKTATSLLGIRKMAVASRAEADWKRYGVVEPSSDESATDKQRGKRLTLSDSSDNPLVDLVIGNEVEGRSGQFYVREPEKTTTYIAELEVELSARFSDWIEPDLLKIETANDIVELKLDNYSVDEVAGVIKGGEILEFRKKDLETSGDWTLADLNDEQEELDDSPVRSIATNLKDLKIVDVRRKPEGLDGQLRVNPLVKRILQEQMASLGYFIAGDGGETRLFGNEGELIAGTDDGVEYTLFFGEIARGSDKDIEVDAASEQNGDEENADDDAEEDGPRRYLLIKARFNEALLNDKPVAPTEPEKPAILKETATSDKTEDSDTDTTSAPAEQSDDAEASAGETSAEEEDPIGDDANADEDSTDADESVDETSETESGADAAAEGKTTDTDSVDDAAEKTETETTAAAGAEAKSETPETAAEEEKEPPVDPREEAQKQYDAAVKAYEASLKTYEADLEKFQERVKEGQEKADELALRFSGWYYVISSDSFEKFRIARKDVVSKKEEEKPDDEKSGDGDNK